MEQDEIEALASHRVLIVEDEYFLASDLEDALRSFGLGVFVLVGNLEEALDQVARGAFDVAIIDMNLRGRATHSVADQLKRTGIPFVFTTGYSAAMVPARFADVTVWEKPFDALKVAEDVVRLCRSPS
jgi:CheY-like chemotaxis protein